MRLGTAPQIERLTQSHRVWREGSALASFAVARRRAPVGTSFSIVLDQPAAVTLTFTQQVAGRRLHGRCVAPTKRNRRKPSCRRTLKRGVLSVHAHKGVNTVSFQGRIARSRRLPLGAYALTAAASNAAGRRPAASRLAFTIVK